MTFSHAASLDAQKFASTCSVLSKIDSFSSFAQTKTKNNPNQLLPIEILNTQQQQQQQQQQHELTAFKNFY
jgi:hypothetical protein